MAKSYLHTEHEHHLHFKKGVLSIYVLGGLNGQSFDSLRVTLKAEKGQFFIRHTLDLYNHVEVEYYIQKLAETLEIQTSDARAAAYDLTNLLESYRFEDKVVEELPTGASKTKALKFLQETKLIERTNKLIGEYGVIGEEKNRLLMYLIYVNCKQANPLHIVSYGNSGSGKTHLQNMVAELIPEEYKIENTSITANALYYFNNDELKNKIVLLEDLDGTSDALYVLRELQTRHKVTKTIAHRDMHGNTKGVQITARGPITLAGCTTKEQLYEDNANRCFQITIDESTEQDERIVAYQKKKSAGKIDESKRSEIQQLFHNNMKMLQAIKVVNPFAEHLDIPSNVLKPRRTISHYLHAIEAVTYYHQHQREHKTNNKTGEKYIESTLEDVKIANQLMKEVLLQKTDYLPISTRRYFEKLKSHISRVEEDSFTNRSMMTSLRIPIGSVKRYHKQLEERGYLKKTQEGKTFSYTLSETDNYNWLKTEVENVLDANLLRIRRLTGSVTAQLATEPIKPLITKEKGLSAHQITKKVYTP